MNVAAANSQSFLCYFSATAHVKESAVVSSVFCPFSPADDCLFSVIPLCFPFFRSVLLTGRLSRLDDRLIFLFIIICESDLTLKKTTVQQQVQLPFSVSILRKQLVYVYEPHCLTA